MRLRMVCASALLVLACAKGPGPVPEPALLYADFDVDFGDVAVDGLRIVELPVRSLTGDPAYLEAAITGSGPFAIENQGPVLVPGDADVLVRISFRPTAAGEAAGVLKLALRGLPNPPVAVRLKARGVTPEIEVAALHGGDDPETRSDHVSFGAVPLGAHTQDLSVAITNVGTVTASLATPTFTDDQPFFFLHPGSSGPTRKDELFKSVEIPPLAPHTTARLRVVYAPTLAVAQESVLELSVCSSCEPDRVFLDGEGVYPDVDPLPPELDAGSVLVGETGTVQVELEGYAGLHLPFDLLGLAIDGPGASAFSIDPSVAPGHVAAGRLVVPVRFTPGFVGAVEAQLRAEVQGGKTVTVPLTGIGASEEIALEPAALDFGYWPQGVPTSAVVTVRNPSGAPAVFAGAHIEGSPALRADLPAGPFELSASSMQLPVEIQLLAKLPGHVSGTLVLDPGLPGQVEVRLPISAEVVPSGFCSLWVSPGNLRFGLRPLNSTARRAIRLFNAGSTACSFGGLEISGSPAFSLEDVWPDVQTLASGESVDVKIGYRPTVTAEDLDRAVLRVRQPSRSVPLLEIAVTGEGSGRLFGDDPHTVSVAVGEAGLAAATLRNAGRSGVRVLSAHLDETAATSFSLVGDLPEEIGPESSTSIPVAFRPRHVGSRGGNLEVLTDLGLDPVILQLAGEGLTGCIDNCGSLEVSCPSSFSAPAFDWVQLGTAALDPNGQPVECTFGLRSGLTPEVIAPRGCDADVVLGGAGLYELEMVAHSASGAERRCTVMVVARSSDSFVLRSWPSPTSADLDLRLFHPDAGDPSSAKAWSSSAVCWSGTPNPSWNAAGSYDDPVFHNGRNGMPDVIRIPDAAQQTLGIGVRWSGGSGAALEAHTEVICGATSRTSLDTTLDRMYMASHVADVKIGQGNACAVTEVGDELYP